MLIITAYTKDLKDKAGNIKPIRIYDPNELESYRIQQANDFPKNRKKYSTPQGGEFIDWVDPNYDGLICFTDADMIQQRDITDEEMKIIAPERGEFTACYNSYPPRLLADAAKGLMPNEQKFVYDFDGDDYTEFQAGVIIAHNEDWQKLKDRYLFFYSAFCDQFKHHAMTQLLINWLIQEYFKLKIAPDWLHNGYWLTGTKAHRKNGKMWTDREVVFNHFKFNENYK
jgi:hypothetical protein